MNDMEKHCRHEEMYDPEPLTIAAFVVAGVSAAAAIYQVGKGEYKDWDSRRKQRKNKRAAILRWEAELHEYSDLLVELKEFFVSVSRYRNKGLLSNPLEPLSIPLYLDNWQLRKYRSFVSKLATQSKKLSDLTCDLLPEIEDEKMRGFLEDSIPHAREILQKIKKMESLEAVLAGGAEFIEKLEKTAKYLRKEVIP